MTMPFRGKHPSGFKTPDQRGRTRTKLRVRKDIPPEDQVRTTYDPSIRLTQAEQARLDRFGSLRKPGTTSTTRRTWEHPQSP